MTQDRENELFETLGEVKAFVTEARALFPTLQTRNGCKGERATCRRELAESGLSGRSAWLKVIIAVVLASLLSSGAAAEFLKAVLK
jgi:hypothetical protein